MLEFLTNLRFSAILRTRNIRKTVSKETRSSEEKPNSAMNTIVLYFLPTRSARGKEELLLAALPESRAAKAMRYAREEDRLLSLCAGWLLARRVGETAADALGKPRSAKCCFSLSHAAGLAGLAVGGDRELGMDLEPVREGRNFDRLAAYCFSEEELARYREGTGFLPLFVAKESLGKAEGRGLAGGPKTIPALPEDGGVSYRGKNYFRHSLEWNGYTVSVTQEGEDFRIQTVEESV